MASLASSIMWSGVSLGQLIMTDLCGATAMAKVASRATRMERTVKRILTGAARCPSDEIVDGAAFGALTGVGA